MLSAIGGSIAGVVVVGEGLDVPGLDAPSPDEVGEAVVDPSRELLLMEELTPGLSCGWSCGVAVVGPGAEPSGPAVGAGAAAGEEYISEWR